MDTKQENTVDDLKYDRCKSIIKYLKDGKIRKNIPDFYVIYTDGQKQIIEVKPKRSPKNFMNADQDQERMLKAIIYNRKVCAVIAVWALVLIYVGIVIGILLF
jgi:hypothetical protein